MNDIDKGCMNYQPTIDNRSVFEKAGFKKTEWVKRDPRGAEYGHFTAEILGGNFASWIEVTHSKDGYSMKFSNSQDFLNWAKGI